MLNIYQLITGGRGSSPVTMEHQLQRQLKECDESICLYQMLYDDARSRKDIVEMSYYRQEMAHTRCEKRVLLAKSSAKGVHVCV